MALTTEQQNQLEYEQAQVAARAHERRQEMVRIARDVLIETSRSKPVDQRDIAAADIIAYATALEAYVNGQ